MKFNNVIILGELDYVLVTNFKNAKTMAECFSYNAKLLPFEQHENGSTNLNNLYVLNETLEKIKKIKEENNNHLDDMCKIAIPKNLYIAIQKGAYKTWIKNNGIASTGTIYPQKEMNEWKRFAKLYSQLFLDITIRDVTYYNMNNPRYDIENMKRYKTLIKSMKNKIEKNKMDKIEKIIGL